MNKLASMIVAVRVDPIEALRPSLPPTAVAPALAGDARGFRTPTGAATLPALNVAVTHVLSQTRRIRSAARCERGLRRGEPLARSPFPPQRTGEQQGRRAGNPPIGGVSPDHRRLQLRRQRSNPCRSPHAHQSSAPARAEPRGSHRPVPRGKKRIRSRQLKT